MFRLTAEDLETRGCDAIVAALADPLEGGSTDANMPGMSGVKLASRLVRGSGTTWP